MRLLLLRHGPAGERDPLRWPDDRARPLTPKGLVKSERVIRGIHALCPHIPYVLTSPLLRARETAAALMREADAELRELESLAPGGSWRQTLTAVQALDPEPAGVIALVGHEPDLGKLAGVFVFGAPRALALKKAGACLITFEGSPAAGSGELAWLAPPRLLRSITRRKVRA